MRLVQAVSLSALCFMTRATCAVVPVFQDAAPSRARSERRWTKEPSRSNDMPTQPTSDTFDHHSAESIALQTFLRDSIGQCMMQVPDGHGALLHIQDHPILDPEEVEELQRELDIEAENDTPVDVAEPNKRFFKAAVKMWRKMPTDQRFSLVGGVAGALSVPGYLASAAHAMDDEQIHNIKQTAAEQVAKSEGGAKPAAKPKASSHTTTPPGRVFHRRGDGSYSDDVDDVLRYHEAQDDKDVDAEREHERRMFKAAAKVWREMPADQRFTVVGSVVSALSVPAYLSSAAHAMNDEVIHDIKQKAAEKAVKNGSKKPSDKLAPFDHTTTAPARSFQPQHRGWSDAALLHYSDASDYNFDARAFKVSPATSHLLSKASSSASHVSSASHAPSPPHHPPPPPPGKQPNPTVGRVLAWTGLMSTLLYIPTAASALHRAHVKSDDDLQKYRRRTFVEHQMVMPTMTCIPIQRVGTDDYVIPKGALTREEEETHFAKRAGSAEALTKLGKHGKLIGLGIIGTSMGYTMHQMGQRRDLDEDDAQLLKRDLQAEGSDDAELERRIAFKPGKGSVLFAGILAGGAISKSGFGSPERHATITEKPGLRKRSAQWPISAPSAGLEKRAGSGKLIAKGLTDKVTLSVASMAAGFIGVKSGAFNSAWQKVKNPKVAGAPAAPAKRSFVERDAVEQYDEQPSLFRRMSRALITPVALFTGVLAAQRTGAKGQRNENKNYLKSIGENPKRRSVNGSDDGNKSMLMKRSFDDRADDNMLERRSGAGGSGEALSRMLSGMKVTRLVAESHGGGASRLSLSRSVTPPRASRGRSSSPSPTRGRSPTRGGSSGSASAGRSGSMHPDIKAFYKDNKDVTKPHTIKEVHVIHHNQPVGHAGGEGGAAAGPAKKGGGKGKGLIAAGVGVGAGVYGHSAYTNAKAANAQNQAAAQQEAQADTAAAPAAPTRRSFAEEHSGTSPSGLVKRASGKGYKLYHEHVFHHTLEPVGQAVAHAKPRGGGGAKSIIGGLVGGAVVGVLGHALYNNAKVTQQNQQAGATDPSAAAAAAPAAPAKRDIMREFDDKLLLSKREPAGGKLASGITGGLAGVTAAAFTYARMHGEPGTRRKHSVPVGTLPKPEAAAPAARKRSIDTDAEEVKLVRREPAVMASALRGFRKLSPKKQGLVAIGGGLGLSTGVALLDPGQKEAKAPMLKRDLMDSSSTTDAEELARRAKFGGLAKSFKAMSTKKKTGVAVGGGVALSTASTIASQHQSTPKPPVKRATATNDSSMLIKRSQETLDRRQAAANQLHDDALQRRKLNLGKAVKSIGKSIGGMSSKKKTIAAVGVGVVGSTAASMAEKKPAAPPPAKRSAEAQQGGQHVFMFRRAPGLMKAVKSIGKSIGGMSSKKKTIAAVGVGVVGSTAASMAEKKPAAPPPAKRSVEEEDVNMIIKRAGGAGMFGGVKQSLKPILSHKTHSDALMAAGVAGVAGAVGLMKRGDSGEYVTSNEVLDGSGKQHQQKQRLQRREPAPIKFEAHAGRMMDVATMTLMVGSAARMTAQRITGSGQQVSKVKLPPKGGAAPAKAAAPKKRSLEPFSTLDDAPLDKRSPDVMTALSLSTMAGPALAGPVKAAGRGVKRLVSGKSKSKVRRDVGEDEEANELVKRSAAQDPIAVDASLEKRSPDVLEALSVSSMAGPLLATPAKAAAKGVKRVLSGKHRRDLEGNDEAKELLRREFVLDADYGDSMFEKRSPDVMTALSLSTMAGPALAGPVKAAGRGIKRLVSGKHKRDMSLANSNEMFIGRSSEKDDDVLAKRDPLFGLAATRLAVKGIGAALKKIPKRDEGADAEADITLVRRRRGPLDTFAMATMTGPIAVPLAKVAVPGESPRKQPQRAPPHQQRGQQAKETKQWTKRGAAPAQPGFYKLAGKAAFATIGGSLLVPVIKPLFAKKPAAAAKPQRRSVQEPKYSDIIDALKKDGGPQRRSTSEPKYSDIIDALKKDGPQRRSTSEPKYGDVIDALKKNGPQRRTLLEPMASRSGLQRRSPKDPKYGDVIDALKKDEGQGKRDVSEEKDVSTSII